VDNHRWPRLLLLGAGGQLGRELTRTLAPLGEVLALDRAGLDLTDLDAVRETARAAGATVIVNAAAYTRVDRAETETSLAHRVNGEAPEVLANEAARSGSLLVHFSTDYVFDGASTRPYVEDDATRPLNAYGSSKLVGDEAVLGSAAEVYVFRVGWVYGQGGQNFLNTIQRLARERAELRVVADQHGAPTWSRLIAELTARAIEQWLAGRHGVSAAPGRGLYHMASPDWTTWHGFASEIVQRLDHSEANPLPTVRAITTAEYPTPARRPPWSVLDSRKLFDAFGLTLPPWREQLAECFGS
jgi:dTDP-4-dehydrorhamnose reductase